MTNSSNRIVEPLGGYDCNGFPLWRFPLNPHSSSDCREKIIPEDLFEADERGMFHGGHHFKSMAGWMKFIRRPALILTLQEYLNAWACAYSDDRYFLESKQAIYTRLQETSFWRYPTTRNIKNKFLQFYIGRMIAIHSNNSTAFAVSNMRKKESTLEGIETLLIEYKIFVEMNSAS